MLIYRDGPDVLGLNFLACQGCESRNYFHLVPQWTHNHVETSCTAHKALKAKIFVKVLHYQVRMIRDRKGGHIYLVA